jgi:hypothetical protein
LLYRWLEEETRVIRNYIRDVINDLKKGFSSRAGYLPSTVVYNTTLYGIAKDKYTSDGEKARKKLRIGKKNTPFINQSEDSILI